MKQYCILVYFQMQSVTSHSLTEQNVVEAISNLGKCDKAVVFDKTTLTLKYKKKDERDQYLVETLKLARIFDIQGLDIEIEKATLENNRFSNEVLVPLTSPIKS